MVELEERRIEIGQGETVSAILAVPRKPLPGVPVVVLAHGAGNDMHAPFLSAIHAGLGERGFHTLKFNFPYTERGKRAPDKAPVLEACYRAVLASLRRDRRLVGRRLVIGGKSMGGRMATHLAAQGEDIAGVLLLGYPLHPAGKPEKRRDEHLGRISVPLLFFAGTRDPLCQLDLLRDSLRHLRGVTLHVVEGGDHSFALPKSMQRDPSSVLEEILECSDTWLRPL